VWCSFSPAVPTVRALLVVDAVLAVPGTVARARKHTLPLLVNPAGPARATVVRRVIAR